MDEKILQRQIDALEKLLQIKEAIIQEHEAKIGRLETEAAITRQMAMPKMPPWVSSPPPSFQPIWTLPNMCADGLPHDYVFPWHSTGPQPCKKCGKTSPTSQFTVTSSTDMNMLDDDVNALCSITDIANKEDV